MPSPFTSLITWNVTVKACNDDGYGHHDSLQFRPGSASLSEAPCDEDTFHLGVASGAPKETGVMLWIRVNPDCAQEGQSLLFEAAHDVHFRHIVLSGNVDAGHIGPRDDYTVSVDLDGMLDAHRRLFFRFRYGQAHSPVGRCTPLPAARDDLRRMKLALLVCQDFTNGYYGAFERLAADAGCDYVRHLGYLIYESVGDPRFQRLVGSSGSGYWMVCC